MADSSAPSLVDLLHGASSRYDLPHGLLTWQLHQESGFNPNALGPPTSHGRAMGVAQFMPATARQFNINPYDPAQAIDAAARYDRQLYDQTGSWHAALDRYGTTLGLRGAPDPELHRQVADVLRGDGIDEPYSLTPGRLASYPESTQARVARLFRVMQLMDMLDPDNIDRDPLTGSQGDDQT